MKIITSHIARQLKELFDGNPWLDESFKKKMNDMSDDIAFVQPFGMHSVAENLSHLLEWRKEIVRRLEGKPRSMHVDSPENWLSNELLKENGWESLWNEFIASQERLYAFIGSIDDEFLALPYVDTTNEYLLRGLLHHDIYHLGQIGLSIKFAKTSQPI